MQMQFCVAALKVRRVDMLDVGSNGTLDRSAGAAAIAKELPAPYNVRIGYGKMSHLCYAEDSPRRAGTKGKVW